MIEFLLMTLLLLTALFLILLVLIQRGRGGGLAGAFGGMGGQSAFGTKAGDVFTRITIGVATFWILLCVVSVKALNALHDKVRESGDRPDATAPETPGAAGGTSPASGSPPAESGGQGSTEGPAEQPNPPSK